MYYRKRKGFCWQSDRLMALIVFAGLAISLYTVLLKYGGGACVGDGCGDVINSRYGTLFGIPNGLYAAALWMSFFFIPTRLYPIPRFLLVVGTLVFIGIQAFVLKQFCEVCLAHGVAGLLIGFTYERQGLRNRAVLLPIAVVVAFVFQVATQAWQRSQLIVPVTPNEQVQAIATPEPEVDVIIETPAPADPAAEDDATTPVAFVIATPTPIPTPSAVERPEGFLWLAEAAIPDQYLILSLTCNHCVQLMDEQLSRDRSEMAAPRVLLRAKEPNREASVYFTAAVLSLSWESPAAAFESVYRHFEGRHYLFAGADMEELDAVLVELAPDYEEYLPEAETILDATLAYLDSIGVNGTPLMQVNGNLTTSIPTLDLIRPARYYRDAE